MKLKLTINKKVLIILIGTFIFLSGLRAGALNITRVEPANTGEKEKAE